LGLSINDFTPNFDFSYSPFSHVTQFMRWKLPEMPYYFLIPQTWGPSIKDIRLFGPFFDLPTYPSPTFSYRNHCFSIAISHFWKPTYLPKNWISFVDAPLPKMDLFLHFLKTKMIDFWGNFSQWILERIWYEFIFLGTQWNEEMPRQRRRSKISNSQFYSFCS
jgi:hypothetical protein